MREYRERQRDPDSQLAVELSRELTRLADGFPRFRLALNRLQNHVLVQVRSPEWKQKRILKCLAAPHDRGVSVRMLVENSGLDFVSVTSALEGLRTVGQVESCSRGGQPISAAPEHTAKVYWRRIKKLS
jgi:hypothetical protein